MRWATNNNGTRFSSILTSDTTPEYNLSAYANTDAQCGIPGLNLCQKNMIIASVDSTKTFYHWVYQNSGEDLAFTNSTIYAFKIGN